MALDLKPLKWDWSPVTAGDTYPACNITESDHDEDLARVRIKLRVSGSADTALTLDSATAGITINDAAAWDFTISAIDTSALAAGHYSYQLETTTAAGTVRTEFAGTWQILTDVTP